MLCMIDRSMKRKLENPRELKPLGPTEKLVLKATFIVKYFNGTVDEEVPAILIETKQVCNKELRQNRDEKREKNLHNPGSEQEAIPDDDDSTEDVLDPNNESPSKRMHNLYYIHYVGQDRRLDEWVERERFIAYAPLDVTVMGQNKVAESSGKPGTGTLTRSQRRIHEEFNHVPVGYEQLDAFSARLEKEHEEATKVKNISNCIMGKFMMSTWYFSPFPGSAANCDSIYFCEYCLAYTPVEMEYFNHKVQCKARSPPGQQIYLKGKNAVYEVSGERDKLYCQCLCLLSKLFMDHKTLYFDVGEFLFYVLCEVDEEGAHVVGHFSKETNSENNLACIMVLPPYQRMGYGNLLIQISYELSSREGWIGTPERPLSDLGKVSYRSYWWWRTVEAVKAMIKDDVDECISTDLAIRAGIMETDLISTLVSVNVIKPKNPKGVQGAVRINRRIMDNCIKLKDGKRPPVLLDRMCLKWRPEQRKNGVNI